MRLSTVPEPVVDTPRLLNRWQLFGTAVVAAFGVVSLVLQFLGWSADGRAADDTEQLVRVQEVQSSLLRADALATNSFLLDGAPPTGQETEYDAAVESALTGITEAAEAQAADGPELAALNVAVNDYLAAVAAAGDDGPRGGRAAAASLAEASALLRSDAIPILAALVEENADRAEESMGGHQPVLIVVAGVIALLGLGWLNHLLAQAFRRHVNVGVLSAALVVVVTTAVTAAAGFAADAGNDDLRAGAFGTATDQAAARTAANDAKASESLRLIQQASADDLEQEWQQSADVVDDRGVDDLEPLWQEYVDDHEAIAEAAADGEWDAASGLATNEDDGSTAALDAYDEASQQVVDEAAAEATDELRGGRWIAVALGVLTLLAAAAALAGVARGIGARRREFS